MACKEIQVQYPASGSQEGGDGGKSEPSTACLSCRMDLAGPEGDLQSDAASYVLYGLAIIFLINN